jgi:hypothetical protein
MFREVRTAGFSSYNVMPLPENCYSIFLFTIGYKRLLKEDSRFFDWLMLTLAGVSPSEQLSALRTLYVGFRKAKLKRTWDSASLRTETLKGTWDSAGLRAETLRKIMLKKKC